MNSHRKLLPYLVYSCKRVSQIISKDVAERTVKERFILGYHEFICKACQNYQIQLTILNKSISNSLIFKSNLELSHSKKKEIIEALEKS